jgi:hypothetical protein
MTFGEFIVTQEVLQAQLEAIDHADPDHWRSMAWNTLEAHALSSDIIVQAVTLLRRSASGGDVFLQRDIEAFLA